jgi:RNA polymerase sigma-70 factor (ECF subfamily)
MTSKSIPPSLTQARAEFDKLVANIRPELHRYCARMVGSAIDGEDVVQEALAKAYYALPDLKSSDNLRGWLFRVAHNKALDAIRRNTRHPIEHLDEHVLLAAGPDLPLEDKALAEVALTYFLKLASQQRSCVILKDVMGYSLAEISELLDTSIPAIKAALHRGRTRLRELSTTVEYESPLPLDDQEQARLARYIDRFNARDFDAVRAMLADEVKLDLIDRVKEPSQYFVRYNQIDDWRLGLGTVEGRLAILVYDPRTKATTPTYFMLITWQNGQVTHIRDYHYARHVIHEAQVTIL